MRRKVPVTKTGAARSSLGDFEYDGNRWGGMQNGREAPAVATIKCLNK
jgi:hypothetical protein